MKIVSHFSERLSELMFESKITTTQLGEAIGLNGSTVCYWLEGKRNILLSNAIKLAEYFDCSLDFLFGFSETKLTFVPQKNCPPFYDRLRQIMKLREITRYRIVKDKLVSDSSFTAWKKGGDPFMQTVIDLAKYFDFSLDEFVGRESV